MKRNSPEDFGTYGEEWVRDQIAIGEGALPGRKSIQDALVEMNSPDQRQRRITMNDWALATCKALVGIGLILALTYAGALL